MKKINNLSENKIEDSCGKKGCRIYVLPYSSTKEAFQKFVEECVKDQKEVEEVIKEI